MKQMNKLIVVIAMLLLVLLTAKAAWGAVVINEVMPNPKVVSDENGEYFELYNTADESMNINGWVIKDYGSNTHTINNGGELTIPTEGYLLLCRNKDINVNGGLKCDYQYSNFILGNSNDAIIILDDAGTEQDKVQYTTATDFHFGDGASMELKNPSLDNNVADSWKQATSTYGLGDKGTPGKVNNDAPVFTSTPPTIVKEDEAYNYEVKTTDANGDKLTLTAKTKPAWLAFKDNGDGTATLSGTPTNAEVGNFPVKLSVSDKIAPDVEQSFTIIVTNVNDAPVSADIEDATAEDTEKIITLQYSDVDAGDKAESCSITNLQNGKVSTACKCTAGACAVGLTPDTDSTKEVTADYTISDGDVNSNTAAITLDVTPANDAPALADISSTLSATEGIQFSYTITATDVDTEQKNLFISAVDSVLPAWLSVDSKNKLTLIGTPQDKDKGKVDVTIVVSDGSALSAGKTATITVKPALEIIGVKVGSASLANEGDATPKFTPGEKYSVELTVKNNFNAPIKEIYARMNDAGGSGLGFKPGEKKLDSLSAGATATILLEETVPNIATGAYAAEAVVESLWNGYDDAFGMQLSVEKQKSALEITKVEWNKDGEGNEKDYTYCNQELTLNVDYENLGQTDATNTILSILDKTGKTVKSENLGAVAGGDKGTIAVSFGADTIKDLTEEVSYPLTVKLAYTAGAYNLEKTKSVSIIKHDCFKPATPILTIYEEEDGEKDLTEFTPSTKFDTGKESVAYAIVDGTQTKPELVDCTLSSEGKLECTGKSDVSGESVFEITLTSGNTVNKEKITVKVNPTIEISGVKVNSKVVEEKKESTGIKSLEEFSLEITLTNSWKSTIKNVKFNFETEDGDLELEDKEFSGESIAPGSSKTFTLTNKLANAVAGTYPLTITVTAKDESFKLVDDTFSFDLVTGQESSEVQITNLEWSKDAKEKEVDYTYCNPSLTLNVDYANSGENDEDKITLTVKDEANKELAKIENLALGSGESDSQEITISTIDMASGEHTLTATLTYHEGEMSDSETIKLTKYGCLSVPASEFTITEDDSGIALDLKKFLVKKEDLEEADNGGSIFMFKVTKQSNKDLISCGGAEGKIIEGILHCDWPLGTVPPNNALAQSLNDGESSTSEVEVSITKDGGTAVESKETFTITVTGKNDAPKFYKEVAINFDEDKTKSVKLSDYVKDIDNSPGELSIQASGNEKVTVAKDGENLVFSAEKDWNGKEEFELTVTDPAGLSSEAKKITVIVNPIDDDADISDEVFDEDETTAGETVGPITENENYELSIGVNNPDGTEKSVKWYVDGVYKETDKSTKTKFNAKYTFNAKGKVGEFTVKAVLTDKSGKELGSKEWTITTTDKPLDLEQFGVDESEITNVNSVEDLTLKNSYGEIEFKNKVDLSNVAKLSDVVKLEDKLVAIDSSKVAGLNKPAEITLYNTGLTNPVIKKTTKFTSDKSQATEITSIKPTISGGTVTFEVSGFSTYVAVENVPAAIEVSAINVDSVDRNTTVNATFTIKNSGSLNALTNLKAELVDVDAKYGAKLGAVPATLAPGEVATVTLTLTVPQEESSGSHSIGSVKVSSNEDTETAAINLNPKSALTIESVEVNGKKNGELSLDKENEFEVRVQNDYIEDMEDVTVTVTILDVDGDDIDEEADSFDLDTGDDDTTTVKFDLSNENVDEEEYTVEILVEGDADDDSTHETFSTMKVKVDRQKHQVLLNEVKSSSTILECNRQASLEVEIKNLGKSDEDDVMIKVKNTALGMDLTKDNIELDDYSGGDNTYDASFNLNLEGAAAGTYPITVELYRDGSLEESDSSVNLEVKECLTASTATQTQPSYSAEQLAQQLQQQLLAKKQAEQLQPVTQTTTKVAFRDTPEYTLMLGALVMLGFIAIVLAFAVLMKGGKRKVE